MADILTFLVALDTNAKRATLDLQAAASAAGSAASAGAIAGGSGPGGMGATPGADAGPNTAGGVTNAGSMTTTVLTPAQLAAELISLTGRVNPLSGTLGGR